MRKQMGSTPQGGLEKHNIPLEITMYMVSPTIGEQRDWQMLKFVIEQSAFVHNLQKRKSIDVPTISGSM